MKLSRRRLLGLAAAAIPSLSAAGCSSPSEEADSGWDRGQLAHLLPTASATAVNIKTSFRTPLASTPVMIVEGDSAEQRRVEGLQGDQAGRFFTFRVGDLSSDREYTLRLHASDREETPLCEAWPLAGFTSGEGAPA